MNYNMWLKCNFEISYKKTWNLCLLTYLSQISYLRLQNDSRNAKTDQHIKWSIMHIFSETEHP